MQTLRVGVVGLGFAGTAAALLLKRAGHHVTVYEEAAAPGAVGAGIVLQPTGMAALAELGVLSQAIERGARLDELYCATPDGAPIVRLRYADLGADLFGLGMHRGALFEMLYSAANAAGVGLNLGTEITAIEQTPAAALVVAASGARHGPYDLVVVANGARTQLHAPSLVARNRPYPYGALWFVGSDRLRTSGSVLRQVADGTQRFIGLLPTGLGPRANGSVPLVTLFWSIRLDAVAAFRQSDIARFKKQVRKLAPEVDFVLEQIHSTDELLASSYLDVALRRPYVGQVVYIGDAAHAMSPQLGQGCNIGLCDAVVLARCLAGEPPSLEHALGAYAVARRHQVAFYQFASRWLTPFFQSDQTWLGPLRDLGMKWGSRLPPLRRAMTTTMVGVRRGLLRPNLALPAATRPLIEGTSSTDPRNPRADGR